MVQHRAEDSSRGVSRRDFLGMSASAVSAGLAGGLAIGRSAHAAGSDVLKVGLIGCGGRGSDAAVNALNADKNAKLVALAIEGDTNWRYEGKVQTNMYDAEHRGLFEAIRSGKPVNNGLYMVRSTMVAVLGQMACYTGQKITWQQAWNSTYKAGPEQVSWDMPPPVKPDASGNYPVPIPGITKLA